MTRENKAKQVREGEYPWEKWANRCTPPPPSIGEGGQGVGSRVRPFCLKFFPLIRNKKFGSVSHVFHYFTIKFHFSFFASFLFKFFALLHFSNFHFEAKQSKAKFKSIFSFFSPFFAFFGFFRFKFFASLRFSNFCFKAKQSKAKFKSFFQV